MKTILKYDKWTDTVDRVERSAHHYRNYKRNRRSEERAKNWRRSDFEGKAVIDFGCSYGGMLQAALDHGAKYAVGLEYCPEAVAACRENGLNVHRADLDDPSIWRSPMLMNGGFDTALFLAVWKTSPFSERCSLISKIWACCNVMYWETHRQESIVEVAHYAIQYTNCTHIELIDTFPEEERRLLRVSKDDVPDDVEPWNGSTFREIWIPCPTSRS